MYHEGESNKRDLEPLRAGYREKVRPQMKKSLAVTGLVAAVLLMGAGVLRYSSDAASPAPSPLPSMKMVVAAAVAQDEAADEAANQGDAGEAAPAEAPAAVAQHRHPRFPTRNLRVPLLGAYASCTVRTAPAHDHTREQSRSGDTRLQPSG